MHESVCFVRNVDLYHWILVYNFTSNCVRFVCMFVVRIFSCSFVSLSALYVFLSLSLCVLFHHIFIDFSSLFEI